MKMNSYCTVYRTMNLGEYFEIIHINNNMDRIKDIIPFVDKGDPDILFVGFGTPVENPEVNDDGFMTAICNDKSYIFGKIANRYTLAQYAKPDQFKKNYKFFRDLFLYAKEADRLKDAFAIAGETLAGLVFAINIDFLKFGNNYENASYEEFKAMLPAYKDYKLAYADFVNKAESQLGFASFYKEENQ